MLISFYQYIISTSSSNINEAQHLLVMTTGTELRGVITSKHIRKRLNRMKVLCIERDLVETAKVLKNILDRNLIITNQQPIFTIASVMLQFNEIDKNIDRINKKCQKIVDSRRSTIKDTFLNDFQIILVGGNINI